MSTFHLPRVIPQSAIVHWKSCFNLGLDYKINNCFLIMLPTSGKFGLNVITNGNSFFASFPRVLSKSFLKMVEALEN